MSGVWRSNTRGMPRGVWRGMTNENPCGCERGREGECGTARGVRRDGGEVGSGVLQRVMGLCASEASVIGSGVSPDVTMRRRHVGVDHPGPRQWHLRQRYPSRAWLFAGGLFACVLVTGCATGPAYVKPAALPSTTADAQQAQAMPEQFKEGEGWKAAQPADQQLRGDWWTVFGDPELSALQARVTVANQTLKVAEARFRQARALVRVNRSAQFPSVAVRPSIANQRQSGNRPNVPANAPVGPSGDFVLPVDATYEVDLWGRVRKTVEASTAAAQASAADLESVRLSLHAELALNYLSLRTLDAQQRLLDDTVAAFQRALELTINRHRGGIASGQDEAQARTQLESTRAQAVDVGVQRARFQHAIAILVGETPETFVLAVRPWEQVPPGIPVGVPSALLERRPDVAAAERRVAEANAQMGVARAAFFPTLMLGVRAGFEGSSVADWFNWPSRFWSLGPNAVQTLFDGGRRRAVSDAAQAAYEGTVAAYRDTVLNAFGDVEDGLAALRILEQEAGIQQAAVAAAQESLDHATNRYKGGLASYLEVVTAQRAALDNQRAAVSLLQRRVLETVLLIKAVGGGWDASTLPVSFTTSSAPAAPPPAATLPAAAATPRLP